MSLVGHFNGKLNKNTFLIQRARNSIPKQPQNNPEDKSKTNPKSKKILWTITKLSRLLEQNKNESHFLFDYQKLRLQ